MEKKALLPPSLARFDMASMREGREGLREGGRKGGVINQIVTGPNHARSMLDAKEAFDITASPLQSHGVGVYPGNALISSPGKIHSLRW